MQITVELKGGPELQAKLKALGNNLNKLPNSMKQIGLYLSNYYSSEVFSSHGSVIGPRWPNLNLKYAQYKDSGKKREPNKGKGAHPGTGALPLILTGTMQRSFISDVSESSVRIGNTVDYFKYHELGTSRIPQRRMMGFNNTIKRHIADIIKTEIQAKIDSL